MAGLSMGERAKLLLLVCRRAARKIAGRLRGHPMVRLSFIPRKADRLLIAPQDLRTADGTRASEIYAGRFAFAGKVANSDGRSPFEMTPPTAEWQAVLLGFGWLRHLRAAESGITRANARALVDEWITLQGAWHSTGWQPEIAARRIIAWLSQATLILHDADDQFYRRFLRSLVRQVRYLRHTAIEAPDGTPRMQALVALTYAALCMAGQTRHLRRAADRLVEEIDRQVLPDGGHVSRNPGALIELLLDLLPLRHAFQARNMAPPPRLNNAIDRMMPMMRFFRHGDGVFAHFNGMGPTYPDLIATILAQDDARGAPLGHAPHSGYQRMESGRTVLIMDAGAPPPLSVSHDAHAGCLSFELSHAAQRLVVNCGLPGTGRDTWRQVARATAAHSTVTFNDSSSCHFLESQSFKRLLGTPVISGPRNVPSTREEQGGALILHASHDGYAERFGIIHHRTLKLGEGRVDGEDRFVTTDGANPSTGADNFVIRFHLHPAVSATSVSHQLVSLRLPSGDAWRFESPDHRVQIEESVYLSGADGPRRTAQLTIHGHVDAAPRVHWTLASEHSTSDLPHTFHSQSPA